MHRFGLDVLSNPGFQRSFLDKFDGAAKHARNLPLDSHDRQK